MNHALDLTQRHWTRHHGDLTLIGTWVRVGPRWRECIVIIPRNGEYHHDTVPCIVTIDTIQLWVEGIGDPQIAAHTAFEFAQVLRLAPTPQTVMRIARLIQDHVGDLLHIPPRIDAAPETAVAEVTITDRNTGKRREVLV